MNSRERLLACAKLQPVDRVPFSGYELDVLNKEDFYHREPSYRELMDYIRENGDSIFMTSEKKKPHKLSEKREWEGRKLHLVRDNNSCSGA